MGIEDVWNQDETFEEVFGTKTPVPPGFRRHNLSPGNSWRERFGDRVRDSLSLSATGHDISGLREVPTNGLWRLELRYCKIGDVDFDLIATFDALEELDLSHSKITDAAMLRVHTLQQMRVLRLGSCAVSDNSMPRLASMRNLEHLDLSNTQVTDAGLAFLAEHPELRILNLRSSKVSGKVLEPLLTIPNLRQVWLGPKQEFFGKRTLIKGNPNIEVL